MAPKSNNRRPGKTFEERFLAELARQCDGEDIAVLNRTLREQLGWQDATFDRVRTGLIRSGKIKAAAGKGGKTRLAEFKPTTPSKRSLNVFISYCHADDSLKRELLAHLKPLERLGLIRSWHDRMIKPGDALSVEISKELEAADIVFLLVSVDFINSTYCYEIELTRAIERHSEGKVRVVPIILRNCLWKHSIFGGLLALPKDGQAITSFSDRDTAFTTVAEAIHDLTSDLLLQA